MKLVWVTLLSLPMIAGAVNLDIPVTKDTVAILGEGFDSDKEQFVGECVTGQATFEGKSESNLDFSTSISEQQLSKELGFSIGGKYRYGVTNVSASAKFLKNSKSHGYSITSNYSGFYTFKNRMLKGENARLTTIGQNVVENDQRFQRACGDYYVEQQVVGARIFFSIRIDFKTETSKEAFEANFNMSGPAYSVSANLRNAKNKFSRDAQVTVTALQVGGKVDKISQIFGGTSNEAGAGYDFVKCSLGNFSKCEKVLERMIEYATDTERGFPSQISPDTPIGQNGGPALLELKIRPYTDLAIFPFYSTLMNTQIRLARTRMAELFEDVLNQYTRTVNIVRKGIVRLSPRQKEVFSQMESDLWLSLERVAAASQVCYSRVQDCPEEFAILDPKNVENGIKMYTEQDFLIRPEIFSQYCDRGLSSFGLESETKLIEAMVDEAKKENPEAFTPVTADAVVDICLVAQNVLERMTELNLSNKDLTSLLALSSLPQLKKLNLSSNRLESLESLDSLKSLEWIDVSRNKLLEVNDLALLSNLKFINVSANEIKNLDRLVDLPMIVRIDARNNHYLLSCPFEDKSKCLIADFRYNNDFVSIDRIHRIPRWGHRVVQLPLGDLFISGGFMMNNDQRNAEISRTSEIYRADGRGFERMARANKPRVFHTANSYEDKVVLIGGFGAGTAIEIYDAFRDSFKVVAKDISKRGHHRSLNLGKGMILVTGGFSRELDLFNPVYTTGAAILFDAKREKVLPISGLNVPRAGHTMTKLKDGRVLVAGGFDQVGSLTSLEIYEPRTRSFRKLNARLKTGRGFHQAALLKTGQVLFAGGFSKDGKGTKTIEIFDPESERVIDLGEKLERARGFFQMKRLESGRILMVGGATKFQNIVSDMDENKHCQSTGEVFDPVSELSTLLDDETDTKHCEFTMTQIDPERLLILGGRGIEAPFRASVFEFSGL